MEKPWSPQQNSADACVALLKNFIHYIEIPISRLTIEKETQEHPEFPLLSFSGLSEILAKWGLKSITFNLDSDKLKEIPSPSILFIHDQLGDTKIGIFVMFYEIKENSIEYLHPRKGWIIEPLEEFSKKWANVALALTASEQPDGEKDFEEKEKEYKERKNANPDNKIVRIRDNFLTNDECDYIIALTQGEFKRSKVIDKKAGENVGRTSYTATLIFPEDVVLNAITKRASEFIGMPVSHFEFFQAVSYEAGQEYQNHYDTFDETTDIGKEIISKGGQRKYTLLVYLNDDFEGGGTHFPVLDAMVKPKKGRVVVFDNLDENEKVRKAAFHAGLPVSKGKKYAMNVWVRTKPLR